MKKSLNEIAKAVNGELVGSGDVLISGVSGIAEATETDISFIMDPKQEEMLAQTRAGAVLVPKALNGTYPRPVIKVEAPSVALSGIINFLLPDRVTHPKGVHSSAIISKNVKLGNNVAIGASVVIEDGASIGENTIIYPLSYIGRDTVIGRDCLVYPNVTIREKIIVGDRVIIHPGTVIGSDGFGYDVLRDGTYVKIPQLGTVVVEDDVELGSGVTIDRARFGRTVIGKGSKIDNQVQIAHNVTLGPNCVIAAQSGIAGSTKVGRNVVFGGQVGVADHLVVGDFVIAGAKTGISKSFPRKVVLFGYPAKPVHKAREVIACTALLPRLFQRVRELEEKINKLNK